MLKIHFNKCVTIISIYKGIYFLVEENEFQNKWKKTRVKPEKEKPRQEEQILSVTKNEMFLSPFMYVHPLLQVEVVEPFITWSKSLQKIVLQFLNSKERRYFKVKESLKPTQRIIIFNETDES